MSESVESFKVFGCGLPRTGTFSVSKALEMLLGGKCHHGYTVMFEKGRKHSDFWAKFSHSETKDYNELREFLSSGGYTAGIDVPFTYHYKEMLEAFPKAKVLLTVRDPKSWYKSYRQVLHHVHRNGKVPLFRVLRCFLGTNRFLDTFDEKMADMFAAGENGEDAAVKFFHSWTDRIKNDIPSDRLLIFDVCEGWEPLCKFLDVPVPDCEFPYLNTSSSMSDQAQERTKGLRHLLMFLIAASLGGLAYFVHQLLDGDSGARSQNLLLLMAIVLLLFSLLFSYVLHKINVLIAQYGKQ